MALLSAFVRARPARIAHASNALQSQHVEAGGSWLACILAYIASAALIFSAGAQNVSHAWQLGAAHSEFRAIVLAVASGGATLLAPLAFAAVGAAFRKRRIGGAVVAFGLGCGALAYAAVNSLGFVAGSGDSAVSEHQAAADTYSDRRALANAAREELATLKGQRPDIVERRAQLTAILADLSTGKRTTARPAKTDSQAAALGFYIRAAGWHVERCIRRCVVVGRNGGVP